MAKQVNHKSSLILEFIKENPLVSSKEISNGLKVTASYATVKRMLQKLISENLLIASGQGKATKYHLSLAYELLYSIDPGEYFKK